MSALNTGQYIPGKYERLNVVHPLSIVAWGNGCHVFVSDAMSLSRHSSQSQCMSSWPLGRRNQSKLSTNDVIQLLKSLQPALQDAVQKKRTTRCVATSLNFDMKCWIGTMIIVIGSPLCLLLYAGLFLALDVRFTKCWIKFCYDVSRKVIVRAEVKRAIRNKYSIHTHSYLLWKHGKCKRRSSFFREKFVRLEWKYTREHVDILFLFC